METITLNKEEINLKDLGIEFIKTPDQQAHAGEFEPPPDFPRKDFVTEWVPEEQVRFKEQRQTMPLVGAMVPGLTVWKGKDGKQKPTIVTSGKGKKFTLMCRPRKVQEVMNALYGNASKMRYNSSVTGEAIANGADRPSLIPLQDPGMLPEQKLRDGGAGKVDIEESIMALNKVPAAAAVEEAVKIQT